MRSTGRGHEIYRMMAWDLDDDSMRCTWRMHEIFIKRAWYLEEKCMRTTWKEHIIYMKKSSEKIDHNYDLHEENMRSTKRNQEI